MVNNALTAVQRQSFPKPNPTNPATQTHQYGALVVLDAGVIEGARLVGGLMPGHDVLRLRPGALALETIAAALEAAPVRVDALHIVAHGRTGELLLGETPLTLSSLPSHAATLARIGAALSAQGIVALTACDVASGTTGAALVEALSQAMGRRVVGTSTTVGGNNAESFDLPAGVASPFTEQTRATYQPQLAGPAFLTGLSETSTIFDNATLQLNGAEDVTSAVIGGVTYVFVSGYYDGGISVFSLNDSGTLTNVFNVSDTATLNLNQVETMETATIGGTTFLFAGGFGDDGISVFSVGADGSLTNVENTSDNATLEIAGIRSITSIVEGGTTFLFAAGGKDDGVSMFSVASDGSLTSVTNVTDTASLALAGPQSVAAASVGTNTYLFAAGRDDSGISVFSVNGSGTPALTEVTTVNDNATLQLDGVSAVTTAKIGTTTYLFAAGSVDDGISVFTVGTNGNLTNVDNVSDNATLLLEAINSLSTAVVGGITYLFAAGVTDNGVSMFEVANDGTLTNVYNLSDDAEVALEYPYAAQPVTIGGQTFLLTTGLRDDGVSVFKISSTVLLDIASDTGTSGSDSITSDNTPTINFTVEAGASLAVAWGEGGGFVNAGTATGVSQQATLATPYTSDGDKTIQLRATDSSGNVTIETLTITYDGTAPTLGAINLTTSSDTGISNTDDITLDTTPTIRFTAEAGAALTIDWGDGAGFVASGTGTGSAQSVTLANAYVGRGDRTIDVRTTDIAGNTTTQSLEIEIGNPGLTFSGGPGNSNLTGTVGEDFFTDSGGNDLMNAGAGDDTVNGGSGNDTLNGQGGADLIFGQAGNDILDGSFADDVLIGGSGDDTLLGGIGNDQLFGSTGADQMDGGDNSDVFIIDGDDTVTDTGTTGYDKAQINETTGISVTLTGWSGVERVNGFTGNDVINASGQTTDMLLSGDDGRDRLTGGSGDDVLIGGDGDDTMVGGSGNDTMLGNDGSDRFFGGAGNDVFLIGEAGDIVSNGGSGFDKAVITKTTGLAIDVGTWLNVERINGLNGDDNIDATRMTTALTLVGAAGNDTLTGGSAGDTFFGGSGNDLLFGAGGNDALIGTGGNDTIDGGIGNDFYLGGTGADSFVWATGFGKDIVKDYADGTDRLDFADHATINAFTDLTIVQSGANTILRESGNSTDQITLVNVTATDLTASDFDFV